MKVKTFHALTMQDAIRAIKEELGPDAIILSSKEVQQGGRLLRLFNRPVLEVMAAAEQDADWTPPVAPPTACPAEQVSRAERVSSTEHVHPTGSVHRGESVRPAESVRAAAPGHQPEPATPAPQPYAFRDTLQAMLKASSSEPSKGPGMPAAPAPIVGPKREWKNERLRKLRGELQELGRLLGASLPRETQSLGSHLPADMSTFCRSLISQGLRPSTAESLGLAIWSAVGKHAGPHPPEAVADALRTVVAGRIRVSGPLLVGRGDQTVSLLLGPSGAGKTTAITKLAAHYRLEEKRKVSIITFDTYRQASVEQLRMYAGVLGVPFASAVSARQVHEGLRRQTRADVVLIDMPGVGPAEVASASELHHLLRDESDIDMHLVAPASMREHDLSRIYDRVKDLPLLRLLFTKLDETESFGTVFELAYQTGVPLSYWSAGQRVPEDIELATPERLASFLVNQRYTAPTVEVSRLSPLSLSEEMSEPVGALTGQHER